MFDHRAATPHRDGPLSTLDKVFDKNLKHGSYWHVSLFYSKLSFGAGRGGVLKMIVRKSLGNMRRPTIINRDKWVVGGY
jgi:hypothetical protein